MNRSLAPVSLLWKILLGTSIALTVLFALTGWVVQNNAVRATSLGLEEEVKASFQAYQSLWQARAGKLASVSLVLSRMSDVRAAFTTRDQATIRDTAQELWGKIAQEDAIFLVTDPQGIAIASLGGKAAFAAQRDIPAVRLAAVRFPNQSSGFMFEGDRLYQIAITPVYVEAGSGPGLLNVLVTGYAVDAAVANELKQATGGSEFLFLSGTRVIASTLPGGASAASGYVQLATPLLDVAGKPLGELRILRSFGAAEQRIAELRRNMIVVWALAILLGLALTYLFAKRILEPVRELDRAAAEISRGNYEYRVPVKSSDELGRLAEAFNAMCASIQGARQELIRQERISTIGRLSTSIVHDLRNPLAAIYGGAEMLVDGDLTLEQIQRLARNMYRSSRRVQELLQEMVDVSRGKSQPAETCRLAEVITAASDLHAAAAEGQHVSIQTHVPEAIELPLERARMERVFANLIGNAIEAMPDGGSVRIDAEQSSGHVAVTVQDTGPGVAKEIRARLFHPFVTAGKRNGVGLGLALSHQTVIDHGGELWLSESPGGARFCMRLPL